MNQRAMHCYPDERYTDFQLSAEVIVAVVVSNERSNQTLTYSTKALEAGRFTYSTNAVETDPDVLVAHSKSTLPMNSNKAVGSDVTSRPATYLKTAKPGRDDLYCNESLVSITHISGLTPKCAQPYIARRRSSRCCCWWRSS